jgi:hypothetical protein
MTSFYAYCNWNLQLFINISFSRSILKIPSPKLNQLSKSAMVCKSYISLLTFASAAHSIQPAVREWNWKNRPPACSICPVLFILWTVINRWKDIWKICLQWAPSILSALDTVGLAIGITVAHSRCLTCNMGKACMVFSVHRELCCSV